MQSLNGPKIVAEEICNKGNFCVFLFQNTINQTHPYK